LLFRRFNAQSNALIPRADPITASTSQPNLSLTLSVNGEGTGEVMLKADQRRQQRLDLAQLDEDL
jgi:hypothetical protein